MDIRPEYLCDKYYFSSEVYFFYSTHFRQQTLQLSKYETVLYTTSFHTLANRLMNSLEQNSQDVISKNPFLKRVKYNVFLRHE